MECRSSILLVLTVFGCLPQSLQAVDQQTITARTDQLRKMSEIERGHLNRNIEEFRKLNDAEKQHYRQLHQELKHDASTGGSLTRLMQTYSLWVQTLTPTQQDELKKELVPAQKLALIRRFKEEQEESTESPDSLSETHGGPVTDEPAPQFNLIFSKRDALWLKDLRAVAAVLVDRLASDKTRAEFSDPHLSDFLPIIHASVQTFGGDYREWPNEKLLQDMIGAISKDLVPQINKQDYSTRRTMVVRMLLQGIMKQARDTVRFPTDDEKLQVLKDLKPEERERILSFPSERVNETLNRKWIQSKGGDSWTDFQKIPEYRRQIEDLFVRLEVTPPPRFVQRPKKGNDRPADLKGDGKRPPPIRPNPQKAN
ncbi:MAG: hypothetical protein WCH39_24990 [Schlesneria sp.]